GPRPADLRRLPGRRPLPAQRRLPHRARHGLVPLLGQGQPLLAAPPGQGRLSRLRGREVQLRRRDPPAGRAGRLPGRAQTADPQGPGPPRPVRGAPVLAPCHGHQAPRRSVPGGPGHRLGRPLAVPAPGPGVGTHTPGAGARPPRRRRPSPGAGAPAPRVHRPPSRPFPLTCPFPLCCSFLPSCCLAVAVAVHPSCCLAVAVAGAVHWPGPCPCRFSCSLRSSSRFWACGSTPPPTRPPFPPPRRALRPRFRRVPPTPSMFPPPRVMVFPPSQ